MQRETWRARRRSRARSAPRGRRSGGLDDDVRELRGHVALRLRDLDRAAARDAPVDVGHRPVRLRDDRGLARVGLSADRLLEWQLAEELGAVILAHLFRAA